VRATKKSIRTQVLRIENEFASLLDIENDGSFIYDFRYFVDGVLAVQNDVAVVRLSLRRGKGDAGSRLQGRKDAEGFTRDLLSREQRLNDESRSKDADVFLEVFSDFTSVISNSDAPAIARGVSGEDLRTPMWVIDLKTSDDDRDRSIDPSILQTAIASQTRVLPGSSFELAHRMLFQQHRDPSTVSSVGTDVTRTYSAFSGFKGAGLDAASTSVDGRLRASLVSNRSQVVTVGDIKPSVLLPRISDAPVSEMLVIKRVRVSSDALGTEDFYVRFDLLTHTGDVLASETKRVNHSSSVRALNTPRVPPRVNVTRQQQGRNMVEIEQRDPYARSVRLLRKSLKSTEVRLLDARYEHVAELNVSRASGAVRFNDSVDNSCTVVYRCIPIGPGGVLGSEFTNAVTPALPADIAFVEERQLAVALNARVVQGAIEVSVASVPSGVVSIALKRRDLTTHDRESAFIDADSPVKQVTAGLLDTTVIDEDVKRGHIYQYSCVLYMIGGSVVESMGYVMISYVPAELGGAEVSVSDVSIVKDGSSLDVRFNVSTPLDDGNLDAVRRTLEAQGVLNLFQDELKLERDRLQSLVAHSIVRVDVTNGTSEDFGTFVGTSFSDRDAGRTAGVSSLRPGHRYRYVITTLLRSAETMFDELVRDAVDETTGREFSFKPSTFRHPFALNNGTTVDRDTLRSNHPEDDFAIGRLGNYREVEVTLMQELPSVIDVRVTRPNRDTLSVSWRIDGDQGLIDHFIVTKKMLDHTMIAGKAHNISRGRSFELLDRIGPDDIGEFKYAVVPVMNDYVRGVGVISNPVVIRDARVRV